MKKIILALAAASVLGAPVAAAPFDRQGRQDFQVRQAQSVKQVQTVKQKRNGQVVVKTRQVVQPNRGGYARTRYQNRRWANGQRFDSRYAQNYRVINNPRAYRLNDAPRGYRYVQSGNDAVLVSLASGLIGAVLFGALN